jgi:hypothetical protein
MKTKDRLAEALRAIGLDEMAKTAATGYYDDFESPHPQPIIQLIHDLMRAKTRDARLLAQRVKDGEFDASADEGDIWYAKEGQHLISPKMASALGFPKIGEH